jgi:DNA adenine methylase
MTVAQANQVSRPPLRYHGGKWKLAPWIISHFPPHRVYVEPFGGGGAVLMRKPRSYAEVYNDRWETVVNVFRVLRNAEKAEQLRTAIELTAYARDEFTQAYHLESDSDVERARKTIVRSLMGFGSASTNGEYLTGFRANSNKSGTTPAGDWRNYPRNVPDFVERLRGVFIENRSAAEVIAQQDGAETLFYVDPPYPHSTRNMARGNAAYAFEMSDADHESLAQQLRSARGMVIVSGYRCELYDRLFKGWTVSEKQTHADGARDRIEVLWLNPQCADAQRQMGML